MKYVKSNGNLPFFIETEGFKIDTMGTYHGMTLKSVTVSHSECRGSFVPFISCE